MYFGTSWERRIDAIRGISAKFAVKNRKQVLTSPDGLNPGATTAERGRDEARIRSLTARWRGYPLGRAPRCGCAAHGNRPAQRRCLCRAAAFGRAVDRLSPDRHQAAVGQVGIGGHDGGGKQELYASDANKTPAAHLDHTDPPSTATSDAPKASPIRHGVLA